MKKFHSGFVALIGRPNDGPSRVRNVRADELPDRGEDCHYLA